MNNQLGQQGRRRNTTIDDIWVDLEEGLNQIYRKEPMLPDRYMNLYTYVYNFCTCVCVSNQPLMNQPTPPSITNSRRPGTRNASRQNAASHFTSTGADFVGVELYHHLKDFITSFVANVLQRGQDLQGESLLRYFTSQWDQFRFCSKVVDGIFAYLNRHWIRRELEEGHSNVYLIYTLALVSWKERLYSYMKQNVSHAVLELIEKERSGVAITSQLIKGVIDCLVELGIDEQQESQFSEVPRQPATRLRVYKEFFETKFLEHTEAYYGAEAEKYLQSNSVTDFMKRVERRLEEERIRCEMYLNPATQSSLAQTCERVLISRQLELFQNEFTQLLQNNKDEDIGRMYLLCSRVEGGLDELRGLLEQHIKRMGLVAIDKVKDSAVTDARLYVSTILEVHSRYAYLVSTAFQNESGFVQALDKAATSFINRNAVTQPNPYEAAQASKSPELLARYCDQILRKSAKNTEDSEMEELLTQVMVVFKYIEDKDVFQKYYTKMFAKRLIGELSASDEAESSMIAKLKQMCGYEYTNKMQRMFTDKGLSKDLSDKFRERLLDKGVNLRMDFNVMVLCLGSWPSQTILTMQIPQKLTTCMEHFSTFYNELHSGRKLTWVYGQSRGELITHGYPKRYSFLALTAQMAVLLLYNDKLEYTIGAITEMLAVKKEQIVPILASLVKADILTGPAQNEFTQNMADSITLSLNTDYQNKKLRVDLGKSVMRTETKQEPTEVQQNVDDNRKMVIQACIVRIMKTRKRAQHPSLMSEVIAQLSSRFPPKVMMVKKCIDILIEKEYLKRVDGQRDTYEYLA